jgi:hypothetical protein
MSISLRALLLAFLSLAPLSTAAQRGAIWPSLGEPPKGSGGAGDAALIAAIERYAFVAPVPGARANAVDWYNHFVLGRGTPIDSVKLLRDAEVTREKLLRYARRMAARVRPGGTLWFVFIGHGAPSKDGTDSLLVGVDAQQDADSLYERSLRRSELLDVLSGSKAARLVLLFDACFSGRTSQGKPIVPGLQPLVVTGPPTRLDPRVVMLTAAKGNEFAGPLPGADRPAFSYLALGALRGWADEDGNGRVSAREVHAYAQRAMATLVNDRTQTPTLEGSEASDLGAGREKGPSLAAMVVRAAPVGRTGAPEAVVTKAAPSSTYAVAPQIGPSIFYSYGETRTVFGFFFDVDGYVSGAFAFGAMVNLGLGSGFLHVDVGPELKWKWRLGQTGRHVPYLRVGFPFRFTQVSATDQFSGESTSTQYLSAGTVYFGGGYKFFVSERVGIGIDLGFVPTIIFDPVTDFAFTFNLGFGLEVRL